MTIENESKGKKNKLNQFVAKRPQRNQLIRREIIGEEEKSM
jgi:hypothetical protein